MNPLYHFGIKTRFIKRDTKSYNNKCEDCEKEAEVIFSEKGYHSSGRGPHPLPKDAKHLCKKCATKYTN